jgi:hypothetical protein
VVAHEHEVALVVNRHHPPAAELRVEREECRHHPPEPLACSDRVTSRPLIESTVIISLSDIHILLCFLFDKPGLSGHRARSTQQAPERLARCEGTAGWLRA